ncbi:uncharacterized protein [Dermacentor albipictus]|uniref:uncharacterized protein n=1 Tax=Dermacentor albipictus TaxID=60249 RepID=UPI0038FC3248
MSTSSPGQARSAWSPSLPPNQLPMNLFFCSGVSTLPAALVPTNGGSIRITNPQAVQKALKATSNHFQTITDVRAFGRAFQTVRAFQTCVEDLLKSISFASTPAGDPWPTVEPPSRCSQSVSTGAWKDLSWREFAGRVLGALPLTTRRSGYMEVSTTLVIAFPEHHRSTRNRDKYNVRPSIQLLRHCSDNLDHRPDFSCYHVTDLRTTDVKRTGGSSILRFSGTAVAVDGTQHRFSRICFATVAEKPPLVCQMTSPNYVTSPAEKSSIINSAMPEPGLCDYIVLDIPQTPDGMFKSDGYEFLEGRGGTSKYMFIMNYSLVSSSSTHFDKATLTDTGREILQTVPLHGFGFLGGVLQLIASSFSRGTLANYALSLKHFYALFTEVLRGLGVPKGEVVNFFAFKPVTLASIAPFYEGLLEGLNNIPGDHLHLVMLLTITTETDLLVQPSSSWDKHCLASDSEPTIKDAVELIAKVRSPVFTFALTLSLWFDIFEEM